VALANQLRSTLDAFWPGAVAIFAAVDSPIALAFLRHYPSPAKAQHLSVAQLQRFCRAQHYSGRRSAAQLLARLHAAASGHAGELASAALADVVLSLVNVLQPLVEQLTALTRRIEHFVASLPDGQIVMSFPRAGRLCAAQILAEIGDVRERFPSAERLEAEAGVVPLTYESGKKHCVAFRWACNHRLRRAITCLADNSRHVSLWARGLYAAARQRGCDHPHAVRILARAWLRVIWRAWTEHKTYDPALHPSALRANASGG
jgi:transposase